MNNSLFHGDLVHSQRTIYTPSNFARENLFYLQETGKLTAKRPHTSHRTNLDSLLFFIVQKGEGLLCYEDKKYTLKRSDCVFINCQKPYIHKTSPELWTLQWIHFYGSAAANIYDKYLMRGGSPAFTSDQMVKYHQIIETVTRTANSNSYTRDMQIFSSIAELLNLLMEETWYNSKTILNGKKAKKIDEIKNFIDQNYAKKLSLNFMAQQFFVDKYYLSKIFKKEYGITINNYLTLVRITQAKKMLRFTNAPIEEVAYNVGLSDANYFSRVFKKTEQINPGSFRKKWQSKNP